MSTTYCTNSGAESVNERTTSWGAVLSQCPGCSRILKPTSTGKLRQHQVRGKATASLDATREHLWTMATPPKKIGEHFAIGLVMIVLSGRVPTGWPEYEVFDDFDPRPGTCTAVSQDGKSFQVHGWYWEPEDLKVS